MMPKREKELGKRLKLKKGKVQDGPAQMTKYSNSTWARFGNIA